MFKVFRGTLLEGQEAESVLLIVDLDNRLGWWLVVEECYADWQSFYNKGSDGFWVYRDLENKLEDFIEYKETFSGSLNETLNYVRMIDMLENN
ncbi:hypothetical protein PYDG_00014 [Pseudoalteromonas phage pYD6-A]|uniref:Uncharacterized protein n=1 Tax=Pseudoalteromonas phage pYD6-A TaxID=754052 RepID=M4SRW7_9CAUD|nr:hypothetical protein PYDG_00014 [Pseudoalteromonas phage pYD6-A]AGH57546.1 hypothetical protein PYDG_00014 [Pseudoalteromonas phage pYD6-A]